METIYLDHAATTPMRPEVIEAMLQVMKEDFGNPSSIHQYGRKAHRKLEDARQQIADTLSVAPNEIIFNSGGTEGDNTALLGIAASKKEEGRHIITTKVEHPAVLAPMAFLEESGYEVTYLSVNEQGQLNLEELKNALRPDTILVSIMYANNEVGNLFPIKEIGELLKDHPAVFHSDAVQAYGSEVIEPAKLGIDLMSTSAHKLNGPKGTGFLYKSSQLSLPPLIRGGEQEEKRRAGTENLAGITGLSCMTKLLTTEKKAEVKKRNQQFQAIILKHLSDAGIDFQLNGDPNHRVSHILNIWLRGVQSEQLLMHLDLQGIAVSIGSACTAGTVEPSHVLESMYGKGHPAVKESIRISFGYGNTTEEIEKFSSVLIRIVHQLKR